VAEPRRDLSATKGAEGEKSHLTTVRRRLRSPEERDRISPLLPPPQEVQGESCRSSPPSPPLPEEIFTKIIFEMEFFGSRRMTSLHSISMNPLTTR